MVRDSFRAQCVRGTYWDCLYFIPTSIATEACSKVSCTASSADHRVFLRPGAGEVAESAVSTGQQEQERPVLASLPLGVIFQCVHNFSFALEFKYFIIVANFMHSKMNSPPHCCPLWNHTVQWGATPAMPLSWLVTLLNNLLSPSFLWNSHSCSSVLFSFLFLS